MLRILAACIFGLAAAAAAADSNTLVTVKVTPIKVSAHSYYVQGQAGAASSANQGYMSNAGFVVTNDGVVVIDSLGTPPLAQELVKQIRKITSQPIRRVIVTHYHADHVYGLQVFKALGADIWAHKRGQEYLEGPVAEQRLAQRREDLFPWVDENTRVLPADKWLDGDAEFEMGGLHFKLTYVGPAHAPDDLAIFVPEDNVLYSGDVVFKGRVPYVGDANSKLWLQALDKLLVFKPKYMIPGHGAVSSSPEKDLKLTRDYLTYVRAAMGKAVADFVPFDEAYAKTDWSRFRKLPAFEAANRANAYNTYILMEKEALKE
jgi:glyoxylase-like metal-dependent hydrolase (beta-lactamase superfamily II)